MSKKIRLTKDDIVKEICWDTYIPRYTVERVVDSLLNNITKELANGNEVRFHGFGTFERKSRAARTGRNPHTNQHVPIPARDVPNFKPGQALKDKVK